MEATLTRAARAKFEVTRDKYHDDGDDPVSGGGHILALDPCYLILSFRHAHHF
jgi:hypothetical protein